jgi:osmotically-inducible protein OsmY
MIRPLRTLFIAGLALAFVAPALDAQAQSPADQKRTLKAWKLFYKAPGMIETEPRYMRGTLMITGSVPTEEHIAQADDLASKLKGVKEVRNRLRVSAPEVAAGGDSEIQAKIDKKIEDDEETQKPKAKGQLEVTVVDANVTVVGKVNDYMVAHSLIRDIRRTIGVKTINFDKLKY